MSGSESNGDHRSMTAIHDTTASMSDAEAPTMGETNGMDTEATGEPVLLVKEPLVDVDSDRIGGFLWKFPSEGSNANPGADGDGATESSNVYPRKCRYCDKVWVSSYVNERRHWKQQCGLTTELEQDPKHEELRSLGTARRVWCEVDSALTALQWRSDVDASQDTVLCCIPFREIAHVSSRDEPQRSFQVTTVTGRRVVFECRQPQEKEQEEQKQHVDQQEEVTKALDAKLWCEYLEMFRRFTQDQEVLVVPAEEDTVDGQQLPHECQQQPFAGYRQSVHDEILSEITRAIVAKDAAALEELLSEEDLTSTKALLDDNGSSLLVVAFKLGGDEQVIKTLIRAGVDCNAQNEDGETPLLLASASGELDLVRVLLRIAEIDVNQRGAMGATAFHAAANAGEVSVLRVLCEHGTTETLAVDENGWTALHYAAACHTGVEAMQFLCELIPEAIDVQCTQGNTALHIAAGYGCVGNVRVLLETAANPHVVNGDVHTAYHVALYNSHLSCATIVDAYMDTPRDAYERVASRSVGAEKVDEVGHAETTQQQYSDGTQQQRRGLAHSLSADYSNDYDYYDAQPATWSECMTEDQIPYYYNNLTGVSTWHKPKTLGKDDDADVLPRPPPSPLLEPAVQHRQMGFGGDHDHGQKLPLCMIPLASPLVTLDNPTAATALESRRKKDRERRRRRFKLTKRRTQSEGDPLLDGFAFGGLPPPPPPIPTRLNRSIPPGFTL